MPVEVL